MGEAKRRKQLDSTFGKSIQKKENTYCAADLVRFFYDRTKKKGILLAIAGAPPIYITHFCNPLEKSMVESSAYPDEFITNVPFDEKSTAKQIVSIMTGKMSGDKFDSWGVNVTMKATNADSQKPIVTFPHPIEEMPDDVLNMYVF